MGAAILTGTAFFVPHVPTGMTGDIPRGSGGNFQRTLCDVTIPRIPGGECFKERTPCVPKVPKVCSRGENGLNGAVGMEY